MAGSIWDAANARLLLELLEESRNLHVADRDRLLWMLKEYPPKDPTVVGPPTTPAD